MIELSSKSRALIYVDGYFVGQVSPKAPLKLVLPQSRVQFRATEARKLDVVVDLALALGKVTKLMLTMPDPNQSWHVPVKAITIGVDQVVRGKSKRGEIIRYRFTEKSIPLRVIQGYFGKANFKITDPSGKIVGFRKIDRPAGIPGKWFFEFRGKVAGTYILEVDSLKGHFAFELAAAPPELANSGDNKKKGRRLPPSKPK